MRNTLGLQRERVAGVRNIALPDFLVEELRTHMKEHAGPGPEGLLFRGERGAMLRRGNFGRATQLARDGRESRPPGRVPLPRPPAHRQQLAANSGATTRELMHCIGHGSMRAALIYQHASTERDRRIAQEMAALVERERRQGEDDPDGSEGLAEAGHVAGRAGPTGPEVEGVVGGAGVAGLARRQRRRLDLIEADSAAAQ